MLFLQGNEYHHARDLVAAAAAQYELSPEEYCDQMRKDSYWGGGPEIVALCNVLRRPIHVYELATVSSPESSLAGGGANFGEDGLMGEGLVEESKALVARRGGEEDSEGGIVEGSQFRLRRMACFGSPKFDRRDALHILSADSRFPDVEPGKHLSSGNHFLAMFPQEEDSAEGQRKGYLRPRRVRGGGGSVGLKRRRAKPNAPGSADHSNDEVEEWNVDEDDPDAFNADDGEDVETTAVSLDALGNPRGWLSRWMGGMQISGFGWLVEYWWNVFRRVFV